MNPISRKLLVTMAGLGLASGGYLACGWLPLLGAQFTIYVGAVTGLVGLFVAGNVSAQLVERKGITAQNVAVSNAQASAGQIVTQIPTPTAP